LSKSTSFLLPKNGYLIRDMPFNAFGSESMTPSTQTERSSKTAARILYGRIRIHVLTLICLAASVAGASASADVVAERKANFKANADAMKAIAAAISGGDRQTVREKASGIAGCAAKIPAYFPEGSDGGDSKARAEIWFEFDSFTSRARANQDAAEALVKAAETGDPAAMIAGLKNLGASCKACHASFKD
jgi:cytochrome c556